MADRLGIGLIGLGMAVKPHALALKDLGAEVDFVGGFSPTPQRREGFEKTYGLPTVGSLDELLSDSRVDAVIILTPPRSHAELTIAAAKAGKHVLLEKPLDVTFAQACDIVDAVDQTKRKLGVVFQFRFREAVMTLRELLRAGELGDLLSVSCAVRWWRPPEYFAQPGRGMLDRDGGGVLLTQAIHTLDVLLDLAGPVERVSAQCRTSPLRSIDTEDIACASVEYVSGAIGVIDATTVAYPGFPERIEIAGSKGSAVLEAERLVVHCNGKEPFQLEGSMEGGGGADPMAYSHEPHRRLIEDFVTAVRNGEEPRASGRSALPVHALIDGMLESSRREQPVRIETRK
ncbi:MAG: Gfo/Idh/MocA family oxidoreductase [Burkholderiales bacterium]|jgi:predicted dehydrogenase